MKKKSFLVLLVAIAMLLSSCSLIVKDYEVDAKRVVVSVDGNSMQKQQVLQIINSNISMQQQLAQYYTSFGLEAPEFDVNEIVDSSLSSIVNSLTMQNKAAALGLDVLTEVEEAELKTKTDELFNSWKDEVKTMEFANTSLEGDELDAALVKALKNHNLSYEDAATESKRTFISEKLRKEIIKEVAVSDEEIQTEFDRLVAQDKESFEADPDSYGQKLLNNQSVYYVPGGYRMVKQVLVKYLEEDKTKLDSLTSEVTSLTTTLTNAQTALDEVNTKLENSELKEEEKAALESDKLASEEALKLAQDNLSAKQQELDEFRKLALSKIQAKVDEVYKAAKEGKKSFDELVAEFNEDTGMPSTGYAVKEAYKHFETSFVDAAMKLEKVGDVSEPALSPYGYHIIRYESDVKEGEVALDSVKAGIHDNLLTQKQDEFFNNSLEAWVSESKIETFRDRIFD